MSKPVVATISHELGKEGAKRRIDRSLGELRTQLARFASAIEDRWEGDRLEFRLAALGQAVTGAIDVFEDHVRVEVMLPGLLGFFGGMIASRIERQGATLLEKPKA
jgi:putative polyhydroxyalkanoate system protein